MVRGNMVGTRLVSLVLVLCGIEGAASLSPNLRPAAPPDLNEPYWPVSRNCQICSMLLVPLPPSCPGALCSACLAMRLLCLCPPEHRRLDVDTAGIRVAGARGLVGVDAPPED